MIHPSFNTLSRYVDSSLSPRRDRRVTTHLDRCSRCSSTVAELRALKEAAVGFSPEPRPDAWERVQARRTRGDRIILATVVPARARRPTKPLIAAGMAALIVAAALLFRTPELEAESSELTVSPAKPERGDRVHVTYRATAKLEGEERLVLRSEVYSSGLRVGPRFATVAFLDTDDERTYSGSFVLADSVDYAVFALESEDGERVDHDPQMWDLLVYAEDGRPLLSSLVKRVLHQRQWSSDQAIATTREMVRLYPDSVTGWQYLYTEETNLATAVARDSITALFRQHLPGLEARLLADPAPSAEAVFQMMAFASVVGDTTAERRWTETLLARFPTNLGAIRERTNEIGGLYPDNAVGRFAAYERLWEEVGPTPSQLQLAAFTYAQRVGDAEMMLRWGERLAAMAPEMLGVVARGLIQVPALRNEGMSYVRRQIAFLDGPDIDMRPLHVTTPDLERDYARGKGYFLEQLGRALLAEGRVAAALDTLNAATDGAWDPELFRTIAGIRMDMGDTVAAIPLLARVAADVMTSESYQDSIGALLGSHFDRAEWDQLVQVGKSEMNDYLWEQSINRAVLGEIRLTTSEGEIREIDLNAGKPMLVAFWSRYCSPSSMQLEQLEEVTILLRERGVETLAVTDDEPSADLGEFLAERSLNLSVFHDVDRSARRALDNRSVPTYVVIDGNGRVRFESHLLDDVVREVALLMEG